MTAGTNTKQPTRMTRIIRQTDQEIWTAPTHDDSQGNRTNTVQTELTERSSPNPTLRSGDKERVTRVEPGSAPNAQTLPLTPTPPAPTVTGFQPHRRTVYPHKSKPGSPTPHQRTKVKGTANKTGWRTPQLTSKVQRKVIKALKWDAKHG